ncbi:MAG: alpha-galactosidase [Acidobacteriota bacterium]|nr:MAG: alpha-galactosidase [Acidobacteriota bacterium]
MKRATTLKTGLVFAALVSLSISCSTAPPTIQGDGIRVEFNERTESRVVASLDDQDLVLGDFAPSEFLVLVDDKTPAFQLHSSTAVEIDDQLGVGTKTTIVGESDQLRKTIELEVYKEFPATVLFQVTYTNTGNAAVEYSRWVNNHYQLSTTAPAAEGPAFWSYNPASFENRRDWILPVSTGFNQRNFLGMNATDYGGGTPVVDLWRRDVGLAVGHVELVPKLVSLPVDMSSNQFGSIGVEFESAGILQPGEQLQTFKTFVTVHTGDYFTPLDRYRALMARRGIEMGSYPESTYEPIWCAWGYEREFTMKQVYGTLPKAVELGLKWAVLDDGWQTAEGDWHLEESRFPKGDADMLKFTTTVREAGLRPKLWWVPLAVDPDTDLLEEHPEYALINADGSYQDISWWNAYYLCPAYGPVQEYTRELVRKIIRDWDYDGLKIDGQHLNGAPPCFNEAHNHARPEEAVEAMPQFFKAIYDTALEIKQDAVVEICPCGASYSFFTMPYMNQPVSSDPLSSWQIRLKGKTFKALMGRDAPYYGDHVELSDNGTDFASTIGIGAVPGTKFTWPIGAMKDSRIDLTPEREEAWAHWLKIYQEKQLSKGRYLGELYDIGFDQPETHAIAREGNLYYAFYSDSFSGDIELRGLEEKTYQLTDYVNGQDLGTVTGPTATVNASFTGSLLIEAQPN